MEFILCAMRCAACLRATTLVFATLLMGLAASGIAVPPPAPAPAPGRAATLPTTHPLVIVEAGRSDYRIVIAAKADKTLCFAAAELQNNIKQMTGVELPIVADNEAPASQPKRIIIGVNVAARALHVEIDALTAKKLGDEGYWLYTAGVDVVVAGVGHRGCLYGVYALLDDKWGCRWFTPAVSRIPKVQKLELLPLNETFVPVFEYRDVATLDCMDTTWSARNRVNGVLFSMPGPWGGVRFGDGLWCHTFKDLIPVETYFKDHPEYFSEINGNRISDKTQLCPTNADVVRLVTKGVLARIKSDPTGSFYSVSQNDWGNYCQCAECWKLIQREGSPAAPLLQLVNRVAEAVEKEYPGKLIETLAYTWGRKPPKTIRPRANVVIRLCSIECCVSHPLDNCSDPRGANRAFMADLKAWSRVAPRLWAWTYETDFACYLLPFPNYHTWQDNLRILAENKVRGVFMLDNVMSSGGELSAMGGYVRARLLWKPMAPRGEAEKIIDEFLTGVYGRGGPFIHQYMNLLTSKMVREKIHLGIYDGPYVSYLTDDVLAKADILWDQAEKAVAKDPATLLRVKHARLSLDYAFIERARRQDIGLTHKFDHAKFTVMRSPALAAKIDRFFDLGQRTGISALCEGPPPCDLIQYRSGLGVLLEPATELKLEPAAAVKVGRIQPGLVMRYFEGPWERWPDFDKLTPKTRVVAKDTDLSMCRQEDQFVVRFNGYFRAGRDGVYAFTLTTGGGQANLTIAGNDAGEVTPNGSTMRFVALKTGLHRMQLTFIPTAGEPALVVWMVSPDAPRKVKVPPIMWFSEN